MQILPVLRTDHHPSGSIRRPLTGVALRYFPEAIGNDYLVLGTLDRALHRQGKAGHLDQETLLRAFTPFKGYLRVEMRGGWTFGAA